MNIFGQSALVFLGIATALGVVSLIVTIKVVELAKATQEGVKYLLSVLSTAVVVFATKFIGVKVVWTLVGFIPNPGEPVPDIPVVPDMPAIGWITTGILAWFIAGGIWDFRKFIKK